MKLISMTDFVLEQHGFSDTEVRLNTPFANERFRERVSNYANFLKQPLKLEMFVPCDEDGDVLEKPIKENFTDETGFVNNAFFIETNDYLKAEENILFKDFEFTDSQKYSVNNKIKLSVSPYGLNDEKLLLTKLNEQNKFHTWFQLFTIEDLIQCELELTPNAIKRIFG
jgi:hypothetical protein